MRLTDGQTDGRAVKGRILLDLPQTPIIPHYPIAHHQPSSSSSAAAAAAAAAVGLHH